MFPVKRRGAIYRAPTLLSARPPGVCRIALLRLIVLFLNNLTLSTFRHPILQARRGKNNYEKHYIWNIRVQPYSTLTFPAPARVMSSSRSVFSGVTR